jgi:glycosyltransferase involved in cell wall biosynthesis
MSRILIISGFKTFPAQTGGSVRTAGIARSLARMGHQVRLYAFAGREQHYRMANKPAHLVEEIEPDLVEETHLGWTVGVTQTVFRRLGYPRVWQYWMMQRAWIPQRLRQALREADLIFGDLPYCPRIPGAEWRDKPWFLISHNLEHELLRQGGPRERRFADWMERVERAAPQNFVDILTCAPGDRDFFLRHDPARRLRAPIVTSGVDPQAYVPAPGDRARVRAGLGLTDDDQLVIFSGSRFGPNVDALERLKAFARGHQAWLRERRLHLLVAGSIEASAWRGHGMIATGRVPEMLPYLAAADAGLNPVTRGSGANVKLFEYLAARLPVISTPFGVRGSSLAAGRDYIAFDPDDPRPAFEALLARDRTAWRQHAEAVWALHREECDITAITRAAVSQLPGF